MTKRQENWLTIGLAYETEPIKRTLRQHNITLFGLCFAIVFVKGWKEFRALKSFEPKTKNKFWWPLHRKYDFERASFAYLLANMTDKDYRVLTESAPC